MGTSWNRTSIASANWNPGTFWLDAVPAGRTVLRIRFSWGYTITTAALSDMSYTQFNGVAFGIVTTVGNGSEAVPNALSAPNDVAPPTQRWLWWEVRAPVVTAVDEAANVITWRDSGAQGPIDMRAQVLATGIPAGDTLNVWASWSGGYAPDVPGSHNVWVGASVLTKT